MVGILRNFNELFFPYKHYVQKYYKVSSYENNLEDRRPKVETETMNMAE